MKKLLSIIICVILLTCCIIPAFAYSSDRTAELVVDEIQIFSEEELLSLRDKANALSQKYDCDIVIYAASNYPKETEDDSLEYLLDVNNYGSGEEDSAMMFIYFESEQRVALMTEGLGYDVYLSYGLDYFLDDPIDKFNEDLWYEGFDLFLDNADLAFSNIVNREETPKEYESEKTEGFVVDEANILTEEERSVLNEKAESISKRFNSDVVIYTVWQYEGASVEEGAEIIFEENNYGTGDDRSFIMLLLSFADRDYDIMAHGYANLVFTDYGKEVLADSFKPHFKNDNWYEGFEAYLTRVEEYFEYEQAGTPVDVDSDPYDVMTTKDYLITIAVALIPALIIVFVMKSKMKSAVAHDMAASYMSGNGLNLKVKKDQYLRKNISRTYSPRENDSGGSGGTSVNSGGSSHSSGKF